MKTQLIMADTTTNPFDDDHLHEECAIFGIYGTNEANVNTALACMLQHRGQEAAGIVTFDGRHFHAHRALVMSVKTLMRVQPKCRLYTAMWQLGIIAIRQAEKPMP